MIISNRKIKTYLGTLSKLLKGADKGVHDHFHAG